MILHLMQAVGDTVSNAVSELITAAPTHAYSAAFDDEEDISRWNKGICVNGSKAISIKLSTANQLVLSPTSGGKSSVVIIPSIFTLARGKSSMVINDPSGGELFKKTSGYLRQEGYRVLRIDFSNSAISETYNCLSDCKTFTAIEKLAVILIKNSPLGNSKGDQFWEYASISALGVILRFLVFHAPPEMRTLHNAFFE